MSDTYDAPRGDEPTVHLPMRQIYASGLGWPVWWMKHYANDLKAVRPQALSGIQRDALREVQDTIAGLLGRNS